jgi:hypothetical protein
MKNLKLLKDYYFKLSNKGKIIFIIIGLVLMIGAIELLK